MAKSGEPEIDDGFDIIHETDKYVAVGKSGNCPVHEGGLYRLNCLTRIIEDHFGYRLYPVYRLDRETSGIVVFAKMRDYVRSIRISGKEYLAICEGMVREGIKIDVPIGERQGDFVRWKKCVDPLGKAAATRIFPVSSHESMSVISAVLQTGRQHQIRVHMQHIGHPIVGDKMYGDTDRHFADYIARIPCQLPMRRQALHLARIVVDGTLIRCPVPADMETFAREHGLGFEAGLA